MIFRPLTKALLMLMLLLSGILLLSACGGESDGRAVVYVNGEAGADTNAGTKGAPVATLECAFSKLEAGGTAVISGKTTVDAPLSLADNTETVSVTSLFGGTDYRELGAQLCVNADMTFGGGVFFDDITLLIGESGLTFAGGYGRWLSAVRMSRKRWKRLPRTRAIPFTLAAVRFPAFQAETGAAFLRRAVCFPAILP